MCFCRPKFYHRLFSVMIAIAPAVIVVVGVDKTGDEASFEGHLGQWGGAPEDEEGRGKVGSFTICCQSLLPKDAEKLEICTDGTQASSGHWDVHCRRLAQRLTEISAEINQASESRKRAGPVVEDGSRGDITLEEMRVFFEMAAMPYLSQSDRDPVFLDAEHVLPALLLALASEVVSEKRSLTQLTIVDIGAYIGHFGYAALALWDMISTSVGDWPRWLRPLGDVERPVWNPLLTAKVLAIEPGSNLCARLKKAASPKATTRLAKDGFWYPGQLVSGRYEVLCMAGSAKVGTGMLHCPKSQRSTLGYAHGLATSNVNHSRCGQAEEVRVMSLDWLAQERQNIDLGGEISIVKIDVEGTDLDVLFGAKALLRAGRVRFILFEVHQLWVKQASDVHGVSEADRRLGPRLEQALHFLKENGDYFCFMLLPDAAAPITHPWFSDEYVWREHAFNALCGQRDDPALRTALKLYSVMPRAAQFAVAALSHASGCGLCRDDSTGLAMGHDNLLWRAAIGAERLFNVAYSGALKRGWRTPHIHFVRGRQLQALGDTDAAIQQYLLTTEFGVVELLSPCMAAKRNIYRIISREANGFLEWGEASALALNGTVTSPQFVSHHVLHLGWLHVRPGGGARLGRLKFCIAEDWYRRAARLGQTEAALYAGISAHYGLCSGSMTAKGMRVANQWYIHATRLARRDKSRVDELAVRMRLALSSVKARVEKSQDSKR